MDIYDDIVNNKYVVYSYDKDLDRSNWISLWSNKLDYYEYQQLHIKNYNYILESFNYYLGLAENAISYIRYNFYDSYMPLVISHKRIKEKNYYNPTNLILDYRARDISQYLKYIFFNNKYLDFNFNKFFKELNLSRNDYILIYGRLLFPCFYFDLYDEIIINKLDQKKIVSIVNRTIEYENYLNLIHSEISKFVEIPKIDWL